MTLISPKDWEDFFNDIEDEEQDEVAKDNMTQREWDRAVGIGSPPKKESDEEE